MTYKTSCRIVWLCDTSNVTNKFIYIIIIFISPTTRTNIPRQVNCAPTVSKFGFF